MDLYLMTGKMPVPRYGVTQYIDIQMFYFPKKELKFAVDDREVRKLSHNEDESIDIGYKILKETMVKTVKCNLTKKVAFLYLTKKEIEDSLLTEILLAHESKNLDFFKKLEL